MAATRSEIYRGRFLFEMLLTFLFDGPVSKETLLSVVFLSLLKELDSSESPACFHLKPRLLLLQSGFPLLSQGPGVTVEGHQNQQLRSERRVTVYRLQIGVDVTTDTRSFIWHPFYLRDAFKSAVGVVSFGFCRASRLPTPVSALAATCVLIGGHEGVQFCLWML